ncbi:MAG TPA: UDP-N-acetylmuramoyl-L-alanine--D-glutamate ligase [Desulfobacterales bacterium]|nr:UDP-N-acetylmuramoyl-L-alanine--D-glutamate ligase [Desulfobacterales bacterium]
MFPGAPGVELNGRKILVVGLGKTGVGLCRFLASQKAQVTVTDSAPAADLAQSLTAIQDLDLTLDLGRPQPADWLNFDLIIPSPGAPPEQPWLQDAVAHGIPLWGELEVAGWHLKRPVAAISGTNGKTTTTTLVGKMLLASGKRPLVGGNIGTPLVDLLSQQAEADCIILEVSSFQLDTAPSFRPRAAALLNISEDHLDRYPDFQAYARSKAGLFRRQGPSETAVLNADDPKAAALADQVQSQVYLFSTRKKLTFGAWQAGESLRVCLARGPEAKFPLNKIVLPGRHNLENIMAALLLALEMGATPQGCAEALARFKGLPHRLEWVANIGGVDFYDDSKGTNVGAVVRSLEHFDRPVVLIAGGRDKGGDYRPLSALLRQRVKKVILLGEAQDKIAAALSGAALMQPAADMAQAVELAYAAATSGEVVLLSPACSSFDMFRDYAERGRVFQEAVRSLAHERHNSRICAA